MPAVSFQAISKTFATPKGPFQALNQVNLDIEEGEFFGLLGPNGAGKTTLISILAGLARASSGRVLVQGSDVQADFAEARRKLGVVPQELVFDPFFNVRESLRIQSGYFGVKNNDAWIDELLENLGLTDKANANMRQLSGGMKRRVLVAQALVHKPPIIVLDEPTAGVDVELRQTLWHFVARLNKEGHTVLLTTHYLEEAEALCGRIAMLKSGQIVALNRTSELLQAASGSILQFKTDAALPPALAMAARVTGRIVQLPAHDAAEIESHLAALRVAGVEVHDMEIRRPDLEDVFLQVMSGTSASNIPLEGAASAAAPGRPKQGAAPLGGSEDTAVPSVGAQR
ncbi:MULTISPECIES: ABC transporter ATP-binding protein [unclassified Acidovorax]|jgi:ABC-2 type transport system ATP-binding protein|uniref:ABC transporter ATP-binding protein n=1 Tax=unclassified Acidovorax TaxID=2684926 RepID=UPI000FAD47A1|nr:MULTISPECIES: ABC transporter ATP-binding protein [unclassified Acidovorax]MBV7458650.1 ABC transporter ATP-binding protein [Acidovorax sp. sif0632]MBV7463528.1 ABC transporter ATP-binding protein [Acidovorax sp. sif0613]